MSVAVAAAVAIDVVVPVVVMVVVVVDVAVVFLVCVLRRVGLLSFLAVVHIVVCCAALPATDYGPVEASLLS